MSNMLDLFGGVMCDGSLQFFGICYSMGGYGLEEETVTINNRLKIVVCIIIYNIYIIIYVCIIYMYICI